MNIREEIADGDEEMLFCDGFDGALIGKCHIGTHEGPREVALYDYRLCVESLMRDGSTAEEAEEFLQFNTLGAYVGDRTPAFAFIKA